MDAMLRLVKAPEDEKKSKGTVYTPAEIYQQPETWRQTLEMLSAREDEIRRYLGDETDRKVLLTGAGTSAFIGLCLESLFNKVSDYETRAVGTTEIITDPDAYFLEDQKYFLVHFARSGNSPESIGTFVLGEESKADIRHIVITCNKDGKLAEMGRRTGGRSLVILLPEQTNDQSLAMTSSFSSMVIAGQYLASIKDAGGYDAICRNVAEAGSKILESAMDDLEALCNESFDRAVFLGSNTLFGCAKECHLKLQEETDGKVVGKFDTFLGLRHGPEAVIHDNTVVVYLLSEDPLIRRYELDLMNGVQRKGIGMKKVAVCRHADEEVRGAADIIVEHGCDVPDDYQSPAYVIVGQAMGVFRSLAYGLKPDSPSEAGVISRVVQGVQIYDRPGFYAAGTLRVIAG